MTHSVFSKTTRARISDGAGFVFFAALSAMLFLQKPEMGVLLVPMVGKELFTALTFLIRERPQAVVGTFQARFVAYAGTFFLMGFFLAVETWSPETFTFNAVTEIAGVGGMLWMAGTMLVCIAIWSLRYAFSIEPEARHVVRTGAYGFVRHPVYAAYVLQYVGILLIYPSLLLAGGIAIWFGLTLARMHFEEKVLTQAFPEYESYKRTTGALLPRPVPRSARGGSPSVLKYSVGRPTTFTGIAVHPVQTLSSTVVPRARRS
jgi:protein-S-isoprenylcysteine O-methyltransferase Ste14